MNINPDLLEKVQKENKEFCGLYQEHTSLKKKVEALNKSYAAIKSQDLFEIVYEVMPKTNKNFQGNQYHAILRKVK